MALGHEIQVFSSARKQIGSNAPGWSTPDAAESAIYLSHGEHALGLRESITERYDDLTRALNEQLGLELTCETRLTYRQLLGQNRHKQYRDSLTRYRGLAIVRTNVWQKPA